MAVKADPKITNPNMGCQSVEENTCSQPGSQQGDQE